MKLYWTSYNGKKGSKQLLLMPLGNNNGKLICIDAGSITNEEKNFLKSQSGTLDKMSLKDRIEFIKNNRPDIMHSCKTIFEQNLIINSTYQLS